MMKGILVGEDQSEVREESMFISQRERPEGDRPRAFLAALATLSVLLVGLLAVPQAGSSPVDQARSTDAREASGRIVNGTIAPEGSWPSIARLFVSIDGSRYICGGTLIDRYTVLTAAHCLLDDNGAVARPGDTSVSLGSTGLYGEEQEVFGNFVHGSYDPYTADSDLGVVALDKPTTQPPMPLARQGEEALLTPGTAGHIAGWGDTCPQTCPASDELLQASVTIRPWSQCSSIYSSVDLPFTGNMFCAGGGVGTADTCQGDSGGPLTVDAAAGRTLVGVVSWGRGCASPDFPGVYVDLMKYGSWIGGLTLDRISAPRSLRVLGKSSITIQNLSSLQLPGLVKTTIKGKFGIAKNTCRNVPYLGTCRIVVRDRSRRFTRGSLTLLSASSLEVGKVSLRG